MGREPWESSDRICPMGTCRLWTRSVLGSPIRGIVHLILWLLARGACPSASCSPSFPVLGAPPSGLDPNSCGRHSAPQLLSKTAFPTEWASLQVHGCASCKPSPAPSHCPHYSRRDRFLIHEGANSLHLSWVIHADSGAEAFLLLLDERQYSIQTQSLTLEPDHLV